MAFSPIENNSRIKTVDALRGFALLGIIIANIPFAGNIDQVIANRTHIIGSPHADELFNILFHWFIDKKFITIFSILFGFGFYIQMSRASEKLVAFRPYFLRRMLILLLIGCIHAYIFWFGDIIRDYAIGGIFLLLFYRLRETGIRRLAVLFVVIITGIIYIVNSLELLHYKYDTAIINQLESSTTYLRYLKVNFTVDPFHNFLMDSPITLSYTFGNILFGFWLGKKGFFKEPLKFGKMTGWWIGIGSTIGIGCSVLFWMLLTGTFEITLPLIWVIFIIVAGLWMQSLFYIGLFMRMINNKMFNRLLMFFAPVGKLALTNYLLQTIFYIIFFFHWFPGLKLYGMLTRTETYLVAILLYIVQLFLSRIWLRYFEQGPVEYLWRSLTYRRVTLLKVTGQ